MRIAKEAFPIVIVVAIVTAALSFLLTPWIAPAGLVALLFTLWFFRDPERRTPADADAMISPADGRIIRTGPDLISIFMNVFNVHVCRAPVAGTVVSIEHHVGRFLAAYKDEASEHNERLAVVLEEGQRRLRFTLVAGLVARRIVPKIERGQRLAAGQRIGLIQFGSRVDVQLPPGAEVGVEIGQHVRAGETPIARLARVGRKVGAAEAEFRYSGEMVIEGSN